LALWDEMSEGSLLEERLRDIWSDPKRFAYSRQPRRSQLSGACAECPQGEMCRGGCTAVAVAYHGKPGVSTHCLRLHDVSSDGAERGIAEGGGAECDGGVSAVTILTS
jgi:radical SAM protein with 4Fe4S-binding SPASM domain